MKIIGLFLQRLEEITIVALTVFAVSSVFINVLMRYLFNNSLAWPIEIAPFMFVAVTFIGSAAAIRTKAHIRIDVLLHFFPGFKKAAEYLSDILFIIYAVSICIIGYSALSNYWVYKQTMISLSIPIYIPYFFVPFDALLMVIRSVENLWNSFRNKET